MIKGLFQTFRLNQIRYKFLISWTNLKYFFYNLQRKNLKIFRYFDKRKIGSIPRVLLSSFFIVSFFYIAPILVNYGNENLFNTNEYQNKSKAVLAYTLNKKMVQRLMKILFLMKRIFYLTFLV